MNRPPKREVFYFKEVNMSRIEIKGDCALGTVASGLTNPGEYCARVSMSHDQQPLIKRDQPRDELSSSQGGTLTR